MLRRTLLSLLAVILLCGTASAQWGTGYGCYNNYGGYYRPFPVYGRPRIMRRYIPRARLMPLPRPIAGYSLRVGPVSYYRFNNGLYGNSFYGGGFGYYGFTPGYPYGW